MRVRAPAIASQSFARSSRAMGKPRRLHATSLNDLQPSLLLVVGIAGGLPADDISLGDIVLSTRVHDFSIEARKFQEETTYNVGGGPIAKAIAAGIANLSARESELGDWWAELPKKSTVNLAPRNLYGPRNWQRNVRQKLQLHYGKDVADRTPAFTAGPVASSDRLVKDPKVLFPWITSARGILAIEMESAGVHRATRDRTPMLSIRSLSDIVGLKRQDAWTKYACASAAAFARAYLCGIFLTLCTSPQRRARHDGSLGFCLTKAPRISPPTMSREPGRYTKEIFTALSIPSVRA
jgi:nucleoside phosphorylase